MDSQSLEESVLEYHIFLDTIHPDPHNELNSSTLNINTAKLAISDLVSASSTIAAMMGGTVGQNDVKREMSIATLLLSLRASIHAYLSPLLNTYSWQSQSFDLQLWDPVFQQQKRFLKYKQFTTAPTRSKLHASQGSQASRTSASSVGKIDFNSTLNDAEFPTESQTAANTMSSDVKSTSMDGSTRKNTGVFQPTQSYADLILGRPGQDSSTHPHTTSPSSESAKYDANGDRIYTKEQLEFKNKVDSLYGDMFATNPGEFRAAPLITDEPGGYNNPQQTAKQKLNNQSKPNQKSPNLTPLTNDVLSNPLFDPKVPQHFPNIPHLYGKIYYENNNEDVNFLFYLLLSLTQRFPDLSIQVTEQKQSFIVLDALQTYVGSSDQSQQIPSKSTKSQLPLSKPHHPSQLPSNPCTQRDTQQLLPKWLYNETVLQNRVWIRNGHILIVPKGQYRHKTAITTYYNEIISNNPEGYQMFAEKTSSTLDTSLAAGLKHANNLSNDISLAYRPNEATLEQHKQTNTSTKSLFQQAQWYLHHFIPSTLHPQLALYYVQHYTTLCYLSHFHTRLLTHKIRLYPYALSLNTVIVPLLVPLSVAHVLTNGTLLNQSIITMAPQNRQNVPIPSLLPSSLPTLTYGSILLDLCYDNYKQILTLYPTLGMKNKAEIFKLSQTFPKCLQNQSIYSDLIFKPRTRDLARASAMTGLGTNTQNQLHTHPSMSTSHPQSSSQRSSTSQHMPFVLIPFSLSQHRIAQLLAIAETPTDLYLKALPPHIYSILSSQQQHQIRQRQREGKTLSMDEDNDSPSSQHPSSPSSKPPPTITTIPSTLHFNHHPSLNQHNSCPFLPQNPDTEKTSHPALLNPSKYAQPTIASLSSLLPSSPSANPTSPISFGPTLSINDVHSDSFILGYRITHMFELVYQHAVQQFKQLHGQYSSKSNTISITEQLPTAQAISPQNHHLQPPLITSPQLLTTKSILYRNLADIFPEHLSASQIELLLSREFIRQRFSVNGHAFVANMMKRTNTTNKLNLSETAPCGHSFSTISTLQGRNMFQHQHQVITLLNEFNAAVKSTSQKQSISGAGQSSAMSDDVNDAESSNQDLSHFGQIRDALRTSKFESLNDSPLPSFLPLPIPSYLTQLQAGNYTQTHVNPILNYLCKSMRDVDGSSFQSTDLFKLLLTTDPSPKHLKTMALQRLLNPQPEPQNRGAKSSFQTSTDSALPSELQSYSSKLPAIPTSKLYLAEQYMLNFINPHAGSDDRFFNLPCLLSAQQQIPSELFETDPLHKSLFSTTTVNPNTPRTTQPGPTSLSSPGTAEIQSQYLMNTSQGGNKFTKALQEAPYSIVDDEEGLFNGFYRHSNMYLWDTLSIATLIDEFTLNSTAPGCKSQTRQEIANISDARTFALPTAYSVYSELPESPTYKLSTTHPTTPITESINSSPVQSQTTPSSSLRPSSTLRSVSDPQTASTIKPRVAGKKKFGSLFTNPISLSKPPATAPQIDPSTVAQDDCNAQTSQPQPATEVISTVDFTPFLHHFAIVPHSYSKWQGVQPVYGLDWYRYFISPKLLKSGKKTIPWIAIPATAVKLASPNQDISMDDQHESSHPNSSELRKLITATNTFLSRNQLTDDAFSSMFPTDLTEIYNILNISPSQPPPTQQALFKSNSNERKNCGFAITQHQECILRLLSMLDAINDDCIAHFRYSTPLPTYLKQNPTSSLIPTTPLAPSSLNTFNLSQSQALPLLHSILNTLLSHYNIHYAYCFENTIVNYHKYIATLQDEIETDQILSLFDPIDPPSSTPLTTPATTTDSSADVHTEDHSAQIDPISNAKNRYRQQGITPELGDEHLYPPLPLPFGANAVTKQTLLSTPTLVNSQPTPKQPIVETDPSSATELVIEPINGLENETYKAIKNLENYKQFILQRDSIEGSLPPSTTLSQMGENERGSKPSTQDGSSFWTQHNMGITQHTTFETFFDINGNVEVNADKTETTGAANIDSIANSGQHETLFGKGFFDDSFGSSATKSSEASTSDGFQWLTRRNKAGYNHHDGNVTDSEEEVESILNSSRSIPRSPSEQVIFKDSDGDDSDFDQDPLSSSKGAKVDVFSRYFAQRTQKLLQKSYKNGLGDSSGLYQDTSDDSDILKDDSEYDQSSDSDDGAEGSEDYEMSMMKSMMKQLQLDLKNDKIPNNFPKASKDVNKSGPKDISSKSGAVKKKQRLAKNSQKATKFASSHGDIDVASSAPLNNPRAALFSPSTSQHAPTASRTIKFEKDVVDFMNTSTTSQHSVPANPPQLFHSKESFETANKCKEAEKRKRTAVAKQYASNVLSSYGSDDDDRGDPNIDQTQHLVSGKFNFDENISMTDVTTEPFIGKSTSQNSTPQSVPFALPDPLWYPSKKTNSTPKTYPNPFLNQLSPSQRSQFISSLDDDLGDIISASDSNSDSDNDKTQGSDSYKPSDLRALLGLSDDSDDGESTTTRANPKTHKTHSDTNSLASFQSEVVSMSHRVVSSQTQHHDDSDPNQDEDFNKIMSKLRGDHARHQREIEILVNDERASVEDVKRQVNNLILQNITTPHSSPPTSSQDYHAHSNKSRVQIELIGDDTTDSDRIRHDTHGVQPTLLEKSMTISMADLFDDNVELSTYNQQPSSHPTLLGIVESLYGDSDLSRQGKQQFSEFQSQLSSIQHQTYPHQASSISFGGKQVDFQQPTNTTSTSAETSTVLQVESYQRILADLFDSHLLPPSTQTKDDPNALLRQVDAIPEEKIDEAINNELASIFDQLEMTDDPTLRQSSPATKKSRQKSSKGTKLSSKLTFHE